MNIFITFETRGNLARFLKTPDILKISNETELIESKSEPVIILKEISAGDLSDIREVVEKNGGTIKESTTYSEF